MNVLLFSSIFATKELCKDVSECIKNKKIGYIPASYRDDGSIFTNKAKCYVKMGFEKLVRYPIGKYFNQDKFFSLMDCGAIHLGGGNTFEFLYMLQSRGMLPILRKYCEDGGLLIGTSAGSIVMGNSIHIASFADENYLNLRDLSSIGVVDFDIKPHWEGWSDYRDIFAEYSKLLNRTVYGLKENQAIFCIDGKLKFYGGSPEKFM